MSNKLISIVIPLHNEEENLPILVKALEKVTKPLKNYTFETILVDDGSTDQSVSVAKGLKKTYPSLRVIEFTRNFGKEIAVSAGIHDAKGEAVIIMDADLQHPPEIIPDYIKKWEQGAEVVVGVRKNDGKESVVKKWGAYWFYKIMRRISHTEIIPHATDYRLIDRLVVEEFNNLGEHNRMTRGLIDWLGFRRKLIYFKTPKRLHGEATYTTSKLIGLALNSFTAYSLLPLRIAGYLGMGILVISAPLGLFILIEQYIMRDPMGLNVTGAATLGLVVLFLVGIVLVCLGLVALYIAHIHSEVINRPLYVVRRKKQPYQKDELEEA